MEHESEAETNCGGCTWEIPKDDAKRLEDIYEVHTIVFQTFILWAFKIVIDTWKFSMLLLYILWF